MEEPRHCSVRMSDNSWCRAKPLKGTDPPVCFFHSPDHKREHLEMSRIGGSSSRAWQILPTSEGAVDTLEEVGREIVECYHLIRTGRLAPGVAREAIQALKLRQENLKKGQIEDAILELEGQRSG